MIEGLRGYVSEQRRIAEDRRKNEKQDEEIPSSNKKITARSYDAENTFGDTHRR